jgi:hypothetical protein
VVVITALVNLFYLINKLLSAKFVSLAKLKSGETWIKYNIELRINPLITQQAISSKTGVSPFAISKKDLPKSHSVTSLTMYLCKPKI